MVNQNQFPNNHMNQAAYYTNTNHVNHVNAQPVHMVTANAVSKTPNKVCFTSLPSLLFITTNMFYGGDDGVHLFGDLYYY